MDVSKAVRLKVSKVITAPSTSCCSQISRANAEFLHRIQHSRRQKCLVTTHPLHSDVVRADYVPLPFVPRAQ